MRGSNFRLVRFNLFLDKEWSISLRISGPAFLKCRHGGTFTVYFVANLTIKVIMLMMIMIAMLMIKKIIIFSSQSSIIIVLH